LTHCPASGKDPFDASHTKGGGAKIPGGVLMANPNGVHVEHGALEAQAQRLAVNKNELEAKLQEIKAQIQELVTSGFVTVSASDSFAQAQEQWNQTAMACISQLEGFSQYLGKASAAFQETDSQFTVKL
jgi:WXG100 family type VII secretion target